MFNSENRNALLGTIIFHVLLFIILLYAAFSAPAPTFPDPDGIVVDLGYEETGTGMLEPVQSEVVPPQLTEEVDPVEETIPVEEAVAEAVEEVVDERVLTQEDDSPSEEELKKERELAEKKKKEALEKKRLEAEKKKKEAEKKRKAEEARKKRAQEAAAQKALEDQMSKAFGKNTGDATSQGEAGGSGNQGKPDGTPGANVYKGGGSGDGYSWSLAGRGKLSIPQPNRGIQADGTVVVEIIVDKNGKVISARPGVQGTNVNNSQLNEAAKQAALRAKFTVSESAPSHQKGYITYIFELQ